MADNIEITPGTGTTVATDDVGGVQFQKIKLDVGGDGVSAPLSATDPLPATLYDSSGAEIDFTAPVATFGTGTAGNPTSGTGAATTGVLTIQGVASMTPVIVGGAAADDAAGSGNPVPAAGKYTATLPTFTDGDAAQFRMNVKGGLLVGGFTADNAAAPAEADTYPLPVGGVYRSTLSTYADGDRVQANFGTRGSLNVQILSGDGTTPMIGQSNNADGLASSATGRSLQTVNFPFVYNGTSWDRTTKANLASRIVSSANTTNATSGKASAGNLHQVSAYNTNAAVRYLKLYNKATAPTVGTDTPVLTIPLPPTSIVNFSYPNGGFYFSTGIAYALTTGAADADTGAVGAADILGLNLAYN